MLGCLCKSNYVFWVKLKCGAKLFQKWGIKVVETLLTIGAIIDILIELIEIAEYLQVK